MMKQPAILILRAQLRSFVLILFCLTFAGCSNGLNLLGGGSSNDSTQSPSYSEGTVTINDVATVNISNSSLNLSGQCSTDFGDVITLCPSALQSEMISSCNPDQTYSTTCVYPSGLNFLQELVRVRQEKLFAVEALVTIDTQKPGPVSMDTLSDIQEGFYVSAQGSFPTLKNVMIFCETGTTVTVSPSFGGPSADPDQSALCQSGLASLSFSFFTTGVGSFDVYQTDDAGNSSDITRVNFQVVERALENIDLNPTTVNLSQENLTISGNCTEGAQTVAITCTNAIVEPPAFTCPNGGAFNRVCEFDPNGPNQDFVTQVTVTQTPQPEQNFELIVDFTAPAAVTIASASEIKENVVLQSNGVYPIAARLILNCENEATVQAEVETPSILNTAVTPVVQTRLCLGGIANFDFSFSGEGYPEIVVTQTDLAGNTSPPEAVDNFYIANKILGEIALSPSAVNSANTVLTVTGTCSVGVDLVRVTCPGSTTGATEQTSSCINSGVLKDTFTDTCTYAQSLDLTDTISIVQGEQSLTRSLTVDTTAPPALVVTGDQDGKGIYNDALPQEFTFTLACEQGSTLDFTVLGGNVDPLSFPTDCLGPDQVITVSVGAAGLIEYSGTQTDLAGNVSPAATFQFTVEESPVVSGILFTGVGASCNAKYIEKSTCPTGNIVYRGVTYGRKMVGDSCWLTRNIEAVPANFRVSPVWDENSNNGAHGDHTDSPVINNDGRFYTQAAALNDSACIGLDGCDRERGKGVCPHGWHVPSDCEWMAYEKTVGMTVADQDLEGERLSGNVGQVMQSSAGSGISMPLSGFRNPNGVYGGRGTSVQIWSSSEATAASMMVRSVRDVADSLGSYRSAAAKAGAAVVRCVRDGAPLQVDKVDGIDAPVLTSKITPGAFPIELEGSCDQTMGDVTVEGLEGSPHFVKCVNNTWQIERIVNSHVVLSQKNGTRVFTKYRTDAVYEVASAFCDGAHCYNDTKTANFVCQQKHGPGATFVAGTAVVIDAVPPDPYDINRRIGSEDATYGDEFEYQRGTDDDDGNGCEDCTVANSIKSLTCTVLDVNMN